MASFSEAFASARSKFDKSGKAEDFTFEWNGKKYNVLRKGETRSSLMKKNQPDSVTRPKSRGGDPAPNKSLRPKGRGDKESKADEAGTSKSRKRVSDENRKPKEEKARTSSKSRRDTAKDTPRDEIRSYFSTGKFDNSDGKDREPSRGSRGRKERRGYAKGGMVKSEIGASRKPHQKGTPKY